MKAIRTRRYGPPDVMELVDVPAPDVGPHEILVGVKQKYPFESKIVFAPFPGATYDTLVAVMDAARLMEDTDPAIYVDDPKTGASLAVETLFPSIIFGNLIGGN